MVGVADRRQLNWTILLLWKSSPPRERLGLDLRLTMLLATASCVEGQGDSTDPAPRESLDHVRSLALEQLQNLIDDLIALRAQGSLTSKDQRVLTKLAASESLNPYLQATEHWPLSARLPWAVAWQRLEALLQSDSK
ncbi:MAG TPA: hypothetical protein PKA37_14530 [Planctomycetota bacterium]|nr:hypothetical protein [Planctomycetota bacterium]